MEQQGHEWLKSEFQQFWENLDVDKYQPIPLTGSPRSEEDLKKAAELLKRVEEHNKVYHEARGTEYKSGELFSK